MRKILVALAVLVVGSAAGCMDHMNGDERMHSQLEAGRNELARHHQAVLGAQTLDEIRIDVALHERNMADMMEQMAGAMDDMSHCSGGNMTAMHAGMDDMDAEMTGHRADMEGAATPDEARALCGEHVTAMDGMMDAIEGGMDGAGCM